MSHAIDHDEYEHIEGYCHNCGQFVTSITQDHGIGPYEYWGARGVHHAYVEVCPNCGEYMDGDESQTLPCFDCQYFTDDQKCTLDHNIETINRGDKCDDRRCL